MHPLENRDTYLKTIRQFKRILKITYKISLLRFIFMGIVFARSVTFITIQNKHYEVWCLLAYLMSGTIELINSIAHSGSLRILTKDEKKIKSNRNQELRIGKAHIYSNLFSVTQVYKYEHKQNILAYQLTRLMHVICSLLIFGQMAMRKQHQLNTGLLKQIFLWIFMLTAYINSFQVDYTIFECSKGQKIKMERYSISKICEIYDDFIRWRMRYNSLLKTVIGLIMILVLWSIICYAFCPQLIQSYSYELVFLISLIFSLTMMAKLLNQQLLNQAANSIQQYSGKDSFQLVIHPNLTLYGILAHHTTCKPQIWTIYRLFLIVLLFYWFWLPSSSYLLSLAFSVLLFAEYDKINRGRDFKASYLNLLLYKDANKFVGMKNSKSLEAETNMLLEQNLSNQQDKQTSLQKTSQANKSTEQVGVIEQEQRKRLQTCSVCLTDYLPMSQVLILPCGHIYHHQCLVDWLKLKKQCPLCRYNLRDYYQ